MKMQRPIMLRALLIAVVWLPCGPVIAQRISPATPMLAKAEYAALPDAPTPAETVPRSTPLDVDQQSGQPGAVVLPAPDQTAGKPPIDLNLGDLGLTSDQTQADPEMQARLDRRTHMLKVHQRLSLLTLAPLAAACISSAAAPPDPRNGGGNTVGRDIHLSLGSVSVLMYGATAYYAIRAPRVSNEPARGGIKLHKYLIYLHAPGMVLTPILGAMAFNQANSGQKVHGIASAHAAVAWTTVASYSAALLAVSWPIHLKL